MRLDTFIFIFCSIVKTQAEPESSLNQENILDSLNQTFRVINKLLLFFEDHLYSVNLDAIYGLRVAQGAFQFSLNEHSEAFWNGIPHTIREQIVEFATRTGTLSNSAQSSIEKQGESYFDKFKDVVDKPWHFFTEFGKNKLPLKQRNTGTKQDVTHRWDEKTSDFCMSEVLGTNEKHIKCLFSDICVDAVTDKYQTGYGPTHHILFLTLAMMYKCEEKYSKILLERYYYDVHDLIEQRCVTVMGEMVALENQGVPKDDEDLYLEQAFVCAMHGYEEFLSLHRLSRALSMQRYPGCFGNVTHDKDMNEEDHGRTSRDNRGIRYSSMRRLLVDVTLEHGCSSHESGVAAGYLGIYTRWLLTKLERSLAWTKPSRIWTPALQLSIVTRQMNGTASEFKDNEMYFLVVVVSFLTTILTLVLIFGLYKLKLYCCVNQNDNKYQKLQASAANQYVM